MNQAGPTPLTPGDPQLTVSQARMAMAAALRPITDTEILPLLQALGRTLAQAVISPIDVPAHDNAAMDGYAFASSALKTDGVTRLKVVATVLAGACSAVLAGPQDCVRIMTGAVMPAGLDTVVPQELCQLEHGPDGDWMCLAPGLLRPGDNRRERGEDLQQGQPALAAGRILRPADLGLVASLGLTQLTVFRRLRVALFSTGDELRAPGQPLAPGCIYDSNRTSLMAALNRLGCEVLDLGLVPDQPAALRATLQTAMAQADAVLTSGGVCGGDADHTRAVLAELGEVAFWKVAVRPGRPFAFGPLRAPAAAGSATQTPRTVWLLALPGNPVAALVSFYALAREALQQLGGARVEPLPLLRVRSAEAIRKRPGRTEFQRGRLCPAADGQWELRLTGSQGAGVLRSMSEAHALVVLGHEQGPVAAGDLVDVWLLDGLT